MVVQKIKQKFSSHKFIEWRRQLHGLREIKMKAIFFLLRGRSQDNKITPGTNGVFVRNMLIGNLMS